MGTPTLERTLNIDEAAAILGCTPQTLRQWCSRRRVPFTRVGRLVRFRPADLAAFLEGNSVQPER